MMYHAFRIFFRRSGPRLGYLTLFCSIGWVGYLSSGWGVELYRCTLDGQVEFRQTPCPQGRQTTTQVIEQSRGMTPVKPALRLPEKTKKPRKPSAKANKKGPDDEYCWKMEKKLEKIEQRLRGGYKASQYQDLHRKQDEYEEYIRRFCRS